MEEKKIEDKLVKKSTAQVRWPTVVELRKDSLREMFLEQNARWLLFNLSKIIKPRERDTVMEGLKSLYQEAVQEIDPNDSDSSSESDHVLQSLQPMPRLSATTKQVAKFWLEQVRKLSYFRSLVQINITQRSQSLCCLCGQTAGLKVSVKAQGVLRTR